MSHEFKHSKQMSKGERNIHWRKTTFDCEKFSYRNKIGKDYTTFKTKFNKSALLSANEDN